MRVAWRVECAALVYRLPHGYWSMRLAVDDRLQRCESIRDPRTISVAGRCGACCGGRLPAMFDSESMLCHCFELPVENFGRVEWDEIEPRMTMAEVRLGRRQVVKRAVVEYPREEQRGLSGWPPLWLWWV